MMLTSGTLAWSGPLKNPYTPDADDWTDERDTFTGAAATAASNTLERIRQRNLSIQLAPEVDGAPSTTTSFSAPVTSAPSAGSAVSAAALPTAQASTAGTSTGFLTAGEVQPRISLQAEGGNERGIATVDMFLPFYQTSKSVAFFDLRGVATTQEEFEGNIGIGYRHVVGEVFGEEAVVGAYGFFDLRTTENDNQYYQGAFGAEFLTDTFEARINGYLPNSDRNIIAPGQSGVGLFGTTVQSFQTVGLVEQALPGIEGELGVNVDLADDIRFNATAGYYHFERDGIEASGPKGRLELSWSDPFDIDGALLTVGGEIRNDTLRDTGASGFVRFSIPLSANPIARRDLSPRARKLGRYVYRDVDILAPTVFDPSQIADREPVVGAAPPPNSAAGTPSAEGETINIYHVAEADVGAGDCTSAANACTISTVEADPAYGAGDILVVVDSAGTTISDDFLLNADLQSVYGAESNGQLAVTIPDEANSVITLNNLGGRVTVEGTVSPENGSQLAHFDIDGAGDAAILIDNDIGVGQVEVTDVNIIGGSQGLSATSGASGAINFGVDTSISGVTGTSVDIQASMFEGTFASPITHTGTGAAVSVQDHAVGTIEFNAPITSTSGSGVEISTTGQGSVIAFESDLDLSSPTGSAFAASDVSGSLTVAETSNVMLSTDEGVALSLDNVSIGGTGFHTDQIDVTGMGTTQTPVSIQNASGGDITLGALDINGTAGADVDGVYLQNNANTITATSVTVDQTSGNAIEIEGAQSLVAFSNVDVDGAGAAGILLDNVTGTVDILGGTVGSTTSNQGGLQVDGGAPVLNFGADIANDAAGTYAVNIHDVSGSGQTLSGSVSATGDSLGYLISNNTGGDIAITGDQSLAGASGIDIMGNTGGTVTFSGPVDIDADTGVGIQSNAGGVTRFTGGLDIDTSGGAGGFAFSAVNGGEIEVTGSNSLTAGTGPALVLDDVTVGAGGVTFETVTATGSSTTTPVRIVDITGGAVDLGGVSIAGTGGAAVDAVVIQNAANTVTATSVQVDGASGDAIEISGTQSLVAFDSIDVDGAAGEGLLIQNLSGDVSIGGGSIGADTVNGGSVQIQDLVSGSVSLIGVDIALDDMDGVEIIDNAGNVSISGGSITQAGSGPALSISGNSGTVTTSGSTNILNTAATGGQGVAVDGQTGGLIEIGGTVSVAGDGELIEIGATTASSGGVTRFEGDLIADGGANINVVAIGAGATVQIDGAVSIAGATDDAISVQGVDGDLSFGGLVTITNPGVAGIDVDGTINGTVSFADVDIALGTDGSTGIDLTGATVEGQIIATDLDITSTTATNTVGISLVDTMGTGEVRLGDSDAAGEDASIAGVAIGVRVSSATNLATFVYGDGEDGTDQGSTIEAVLAIGSSDGPLPTAGDYNFLDVNFTSSPTSGSNSANLLGLDIFYVDQEGTSDPNSVFAPGSEFNPGSVSEAMAAADVDVIVLIDTNVDGATDVIDVADADQGGGTSLVLDDGQILVSFGAGDGALDLSEFGAVLDSPEPPFQFSGVTPSAIIEEPSNIDVAPILTSTSAATTEVVSISGSAGLGNLTVEATGSADAVSASGFSDAETVVVSDVSLTAAGGTALDIVSGAQDVVVDLSSANLSGATPLNVDGSGGGSVTITEFDDIVLDGGTSTVTGAAFDATPGGTVQTVSANSLSATGGLVLDNVTGELNIASVDISVTGDTGLSVTGGTDFTLGIDGGTVAATDGTAVSLSGITSDITLDQVTTSNGTGLNIANVSGSVSVTGVSIFSGDNVGIAATGSSGFELGIGGGTVTTEDDTALTLTGIGVDITLDEVNTNNAGPTSIGLENLDGMIAINGGTLQTSLTGTGAPSIDIVQNDAGGTRALTVSLDGLTIAHDASVNDGLDEVGIRAQTLGDDTLIIAIDNTTIGTEDAGVLLSSGQAGGITVTSFNNNTLVGDPSAADPTVFQDGVVFEGVTFDSDISTAALDAVDFSTFTAGNATTQVAGGLFFQNGGAGQSNQGTVNIGDLQVDAFGTGLAVDGQSDLSLNVAAGAVAADGTAGAFVVDGATVDITLDTLDLVDIAQFTNLSGTVTVTGGQAYGVQVTGGDATYQVGADLRNATDAAALALSGLTGGGVTVTGNIQDSGLGGISIENINGGTPVTIDIAGSNTLTGNAIEITDTPDADITISGNTTIDGAGAPALTLDNPDGSVTISGDLSITGTTGGQSAILFTGDQGTVSLTGATSIAGTDGDGIGFDTAQTLTGDIAFSDLDIELGVDNAVGLNFDGLTLDGTFATDDLDVTATVPLTGSIGVDLSDTVTTTSGLIRLGSAAPSANGSTIGGGIDIGVNFSGNTAIDFVFGDGESATGQDSIINTNIQINAPTPPTLGSYNFEDVDFTATQPGGAGAPRLANNVFPVGDEVVFVAANATGDGSGRDVDNRATIDTADAITQSDVTFVLINDGNDIVDTSGFTLEEGQNIDGFGNGNTIESGQDIPTSFIGVPGGNATVTDPTGNGAATLTSDSFYLGEVLRVTGDNVVTNVVVQEVGNGAIYLRDVTAGETVTLGEAGAPLVITSTDNSGRAIETGILTGQLDIVNVEMTGVAEGLRIVTGSADNSVNIDRLIITNHTGYGILVPRTGTHNLATDAGDVLEITGGSDYAIDSFGVSGDITIGSAVSTVSITDNDRGGIRHTQGTGNIVYNGTITQNNAAPAVFIADNTGGSITFNGLITASTSDANAIEVTNNTGAAVNFLGGLDITTSTGTAFNATGGGTITVQDPAGPVEASLTATSGTALNLDGITIGAAGMQFSSITSSGGTNGININAVGGGTFSISDGGSVSVTGTTDDGVVIQNSSATFDFTGSPMSLVTTTVNLAGDEAVTLVNNTGNISFDTLNITDPDGRGIEILGAQGDVTIGGGAYQHTNADTVGFPVTIQNQAASSTITFTNFDITGSALTSGTADLFNVENSAGTITANGGTWQAVNNNDIVDITGGTATINIGATILQTGDSASDSNAVEIDDVTGGSIMFSGPITQAGQGSAVDANNNSGVTVTFDGLVSATGGSTDTGIDLTNNTGSSFAFNGGMDITTSTGTAFSATDGGTITSQDPAGAVAADLTATNGTALVLVDVTIGAAGFEVSNISATGGFTGIGISSVDGGTFSIASGGTVSVTGTTSDGISLFGNSATIDFSSGATTTTTISGAGLAGISIVNNSGAVTFDTVAIDGSGLRGVLVQNSTGDVTISGGAIGATSANNGALRVVGSDGDVTIGATLTETNGTTNGILIEERTGGTISILGDTTISSGTQDAVHVRNNTGGTINFGATDTATIDFDLNTTSGRGINLTNNTGATINFNDGFDVDSGTGTAFNATGGGTITSNDPDGPTDADLTATGGSALVLDGMTIGAAGLEFSDIVSTNSTNLFTAAIDIRNTSGGTISTAAGGTIDIQGSAASGIEIIFNEAPIDFSGGAVTITNPGARGVFVNGTTAPITFGQLTITNPTALGFAGVALTGTISDQITIADLDVALGQSGTTALDIGGTLNADVIVTDFDATVIGSPIATLGVDLESVSGTGTVRLGDTDVAGASASIGAGFTVGVNLTLADIDFIFGDGEEATDQGSTILAATPIEASVAPVGGNYNFLDVDFGGSPGAGFGVGDVFFVDSNGATGGGDGSGTSIDNPGTLSDVEALLGADDIIVLINDGNTITTENSNGDDTLLLQDGVQVIGFGDGNGGSQDASVAFTNQPLIQLPSNTLSFQDPTGNGAAVVTTSTAEPVITLGTQDNRIAGFTLDGFNSAAGGIVDNGGATNTVIETMDVQNFTGNGIEITPSTNTTINDVDFANNAVDTLLNASNTTITNVTSTGSTVGIEIQNATGTTTLTNVSVQGATTGISFTNAAGTVDATNVDVSNSVDGIAIGTSTATFTFDATSSLTDNSNSGLSVVGGAPNITYHGTISATIDPVPALGIGLVVLTNVSGGAQTFSGTITGSDGSFIQFDNVDSTVNMNGAVSLTGERTQIRIVRGSAGTFNFADVDITNTSAGTALGTAIPIGSDAIAVDIVDSAGATTNFIDLDIVSAADIGVSARNGGSVNIGTAAGDQSVITAGIGIYFNDTSGTVTNANVTGGGLVDPGIVIAGYAGQAFGDNDIGAQDGILILTDQVQTTHTITGTTASGASGFYIENVGDVDQILALDGNTLTGLEDAALVVDNLLLNPVGTGETYVTSLDSNTVLAGADGGMDFFNVFFDADPTTVAIETVTGGTTRIGTPTQRVAVSGLTGDVQGALSFTDLDIAIDGGGTGVSDAISILGFGNFTLSAQDGTLDAIDGGALFFEGGTLDATFASISSTNAGADGIEINNADGQITVTGTTSISGAADDGIDIFQSSVDATFQGATSISGILAGDDGISLTNATGTLDFGDVTITNPGQQGIDIDGTAGQIDFGAVSITGISNSDAVDLSNATVAGPITFGDLDIQLAGANTTAFNVSGATVINTVTVGDFDVTATGSLAGTTGIDLTGTIGPGSISLGDATIGNSNGASVGTGIAVGVSVSALTNTDFVFGDGESTDQESVLNSTIQINSPVNPVGGSYNFEDVDFGPTPNNVFPTADDLIFVGSAATGDGSGSDTANLANVATADANTTAGITFVLVNDGSSIVDPDGFTLDDGQNIDGFGNGNTFTTGQDVPAFFSGVPSIGSTITDPFGNGAATLSTSPIIFGRNLVLEGNNSVANVIIDADDTLEAIFVNSGAGETVTLGEPGAPLLIQGTTGAGLGINVGTSQGTLDIVNVEIDGASAGLVVPNTARDNSIDIDRLIISNSTASGIATFNSSQMLATDPGDVLQITNSSSFGINIAAGTETLVIGGAGATVESDSIGVTSSTSATITYNGTINQTADQEAVGIGSNTGGTITFNGLVTADTGMANAINLTNNTGATVNFNGGLDIDTTTGIGFNATGGGTVNIATAPAGQFNNVDSSQGTAVSLQNVETSTGMAFNRITSGTVSTGSGSDGIFIDGLGGAGTFSAGSVTIQNATAQGIEIINSSATFSFVNTAPTATEVTVLNAGADGILFANNTGAITIGEVDVTGSGSVGVRIVGNGGVVNINGGTIGGTGAATNQGGVVIDDGTIVALADINIAADIINDSANEGVIVQNRDGGTVTFSGLITANSSTATGIFLDNNTGSTININGGLDIDTTTGIGFQATAGGTINVGSAPAGQFNNVDASQGFAVILQNVETSTGMAFNRITSGTSTTGSIGEGIFIDGLAGAGTFSAGSVTIQNAAAQGIEIINSSATISFLNTASTATEVTVMDTGNEGILLVDNTGLITIDAAEVTGSGTIGLRISGNGGTVNINGGTIGGTGADSNAIGVVIDAGSIVTLADINIAADIVQDAGGSAVIVQGRDSGTVTFSGLITADTSTANAIDLTTNTGSTINFNGGLDVDTTTGTGFNATGGGTVNVATAPAGQFNNVDAAQGTAVSLQNVDTSTGMAFNRITSGTVAGGAGGVGILINGLGGAGTFSAGSVTIQNSGDNGINISNSAADVRFVNTNPAATSVSVSDAGADGISLNNNTGNVTFGILEITDVTSRGIEILNAQGDVSIGGGFYVDNAGTGGGFPVTIQDQAASSTITFTNFDITGAASGTFTADLFNVEDSAGTITAIGGTWQATNSNDIVDITGGTATINIGATIIQTGTSSTFANAVEIDDVTGGAVTFTGPITQLGDASAVDMNNNTGGTFSFEGLVSATGSPRTAEAIDLTNNTGATINFSGGLDIETTTGTGFNATGGGTVNVAAAPAGQFNNVDAAQGTAISLQNVETSTGMAFNRITSGTAASGAADDGIVINGLSGAGTFSAGSVTIQNSGDNGIEILNASAAISFVNTASAPSVTVSNTGGDGIDISGTSGTVTFGETSITNPGTTTAGSSGIDIVGTISGDVTFSDVDIVLGTADTAALDLANATFNNADLEITDFDVTSSNAGLANQTGIDLSSTATTGTGLIRIGDTDPTGESATMTGLDIGVLFDASTNALFTFGDGGDIPTDGDEGSIIDATTAIGGTLPSLGTYDFEDVTFTSGTGLSGGPSVFFSAPGATGGGMSFADPGSITDAENATADAIILFDSTEDGVQDEFNIGADTFDVDDGQVLASLSQGQTIDLADFGLTGGGAPASILLNTNAGVSGGTTVSAPGAGNGVDSVDPVITGSGIAVVELNNVSGAVVNVHARATGASGNAIRYLGSGAGHSLVLQGVTGESSQGIGINIDPSDPSLTITGSGNTAIGTGNARALRIADGTIGATGLGFAEVRTSETTANNAVSLTELQGPGTVTFDTVSLSVSGTADGLVLNRNSADVTITGGVIANRGSGTTVEIGDGTNSGGDGDVSIGATVNTSSATGLAVDIFNRTGGTVTFSGNLVDNAISGGGVLISGNNVGTIQFTGASNTVSTVNELGAVELSGTGTIDVILNNFTITTTQNVAGSSNGLRVFGTHSAGASLTLNDVETIANATSGNALAVNIDPGSGSQLELNGSGTLTAEAQGTARALRIAGGTIGAGGLTFTNVSSTGTSSSSAVSISDITGGDLTIANIDVVATGSAEAVTIFEAGSNVTITAGTIANTGSGTTVRIGTLGTASTGGSNDITIGAGIDSSGATGNAIEVFERSGGTVSITGLLTDTSGTGGGIVIDGNNVGTISITGGGAATTSGNAIDVGGTGTAAINLTGITGTSTGTLNGLVVAATGSQTLTLTNVSGVANSGIGVNIDTLTSAFTVQGTGNQASSTGTGRALRLQDATVGASGLTFTNVDTAGHNSTGASVSIGDVGGGNVTLQSVNVVATGAGDGVELSNNSANIDIIGGGSTIEVATGVGYRAVGNTGAVTVQGAGNTVLVTSTGQAVLIENTTIGAAGVTFQSVNQASGGTTAIELTNTGSTGTFSVTGTGITGSGGTIANTTASAVTMTNVDGVSLSNMAIQDTGSHGIVGTTVVDFDLTNVRITSPGDALNEHGIFLTNVGAGNVWDTLAIANASDTAVLILQTDGITGQVDVIGNSLFTNAQEAGFEARTQNAVADLTVNIGNSSAVGVGETVIIDNANVGAGFFAEAGVLTATIQNSIVRPGSGSSQITRAGSGNNGVNFVGITGQSSVGGDIILNVTGSEITQEDGGAGGTGRNAIALGGAGNVNGTISNNTITSNDDFVNGIFTNFTGTGSTADNKIVIENNVIDMNGTSSTVAGIQIQASGSSGGLTVDIKDNTVTSDGPGTLSGGIILVTGFGGGTNTMCVDISGNNSSAPSATGGGAGNGDDYVFVSLTGTTMQFEGAPLGALSDAALQSFIVANDAGTTATTDVSAFDTGTRVGVAACP